MSPRDLTICCATTWRYGYGDVENGLRVSKLPSEAFDLPGGGTREETRFTEGFQGREAAIAFDNDKPIAFLHCEQRFVWKETPRGYAIRHLKRFVVIEEVLD